MPRGDKSLNLLAPSHLLAIWREQGLTPQEIKAKSESWIAEYQPLVTPHAPVTSGLRVINNSSHPQQRNPEPDPAARERTCKRCGETFTLGEGFYKPRDFICKLCKDAYPVDRNGHPLPGHPLRPPKRDRNQERIAAAGLDNLRECCLSIGKSRTEKLYKLRGGTMSKLFPDIKFNNFPSKLPPDATLTELATKHTAAELSRMYKCSRERVRQRTEAAGITCISPQQAKILRVGGLGVIYQEALEVGICKAAHKYGITQKALKKLLPPVPRAKSGNPHPVIKIPRKTELAELYKSHTAAEIAALCGSTAGSVQQAITRAGLKKEWISKEDVKADLLRFIEALGRPGQMPTIKDFTGNDKTHLLHRIQSFGGLTVLADEMGLKMKHRMGVVPPVPELVERLKTQTVAWIAEEEGVSLTGIYGKLKKAGIKPDRRNQK